jgi:hypothetical protein
MTNYEILDPFLAMVVWCSLLSIMTLQAYLTKRMEESHKGKTNLVVFCNGQSQASKNVDRTQSEGTSTSELWALPDIILPSAELSCMYIFRWSSIWAYQLCRGNWGKICSSLCVRSLEVNPVSFLQRTAKVSSRKCHREFINQFYSMWRSLPA